MGFHCSNLFTHVSSKHKNDFIEMGLHHLVTIYLYAGCFLCNVWEIGAVIAFCHDVADITASIVKFMVESKYSNTAAAVFICHMALWFWTRNFVFPQLIWSIMFSLKPDFGGQTIMLPFFCFMLSCLFFLHCYWFLLFVWLLVKFFISGATEDEQEKV